MNDQDFSRLEGLADLGCRGGTEIRPTLLRVLTDLYVQKLTHTPAEKRHYTELALRLLEGVDAATRLAVGSQLARHLSPPRRVLQHLAQDLPEESPQDSPPGVPDAAAAPQAPASRADEQPPAPAATADEGNATEESGDDFFAEAPQAVDAAVADQLNELFFAADANERRLILLNLEIVAPLPAGRLGVARSGAISERLEAAALARRREDFAQTLAQALQIPRPQARRILNDELGEPLVVACKALGIPRDAIYRILMFINPAVGHSVERVHALAALCDEINAVAAEGIVAIWQALATGERAPPHYRPVTAADAPRAAARGSATAIQSPAAAVPPRERRGAS